ncbi:hypothetical protein K491DRAFT_722789 [Lophiostoma macrostomum CBS 122681]|uniref:NACHT domain-containing protein n=1 Tax=Lophiostoma macrostomum CBS 122681 TaxID=1314788 RepID=A0A6A6SNK5_9PLEO|nr:hypothetical protein K491DRAFT_722789 [Lophiostoma macrostomum CBS 122681]
MADHLPRFELYEQLRNEPQFQTALLNLYADVTEFSCLAYRFLQRRSGLRLVQSFHRSFKDDVAGIKRIETEVYESKLEAQKLNRTRAIQWLRSPNIFETHERNLASTVDGTCEWIVAHPMFKSWAAKHEGIQKISSMIIHGHPGCGKSLLASFIYEWFRIEPDNKTSAAAANDSSCSDIRSLPILFSFSSSEASRQRIDSMTRSLLSQLLECDTSGVALPLILRLMEKSSVTNHDLVTSLVQLVTETPQQVIVIVDGVDECSDSQKDFTCHVSRLFTSSAPLKMVFLGHTHYFTHLFRTWPDVLILAVEPDLTRGDIARVVDAQVNERLNYYDSSTRRVVIRALNMKSDGMFLWVRLMLDYFVDATCQADLDHHLRELPEGLEQTYDILLTRLYNRLSKNRRRLVHWLFSIVTTCCRPLDYKELQTAYALHAETESGTCEDNLDKVLLRLPPEELVHLCGGLLVFTNQRFQIVHTSAKDFLREDSYCETIGLEQGIHVLKVNPVEAHHMLSIICTKLFDMDSSLENLAQDHTIENKRDFLGSLGHYALFYASHHIKHSGIESSQLEMRYRGLLDSPSYLAALERIAYGASIDDGFQYCQANDDIIQTLRFELENKETMGQKQETNSDNRDRYGQEGIHAVAHIKSDSSLACDTGTPEMGITGHTKKSLTPHNRTSSGFHSVALGPTSRSRDAGTGRTGGSRATIATEDNSIGSADQRDHHRHRQDFQILTNFHMGLSPPLLRQFLLFHKFRSPMETFWTSLRSSARSMTTVVLLATTWYCWKMNKHEEALELGKLCSEKLGDKDSFLHFLLDILMGQLYYCRDEYVSAIEVWERVRQEISKNGSRGIELNLKQLLRYFMLFMSSAEICSPLRKGFYFINI